MIGRPYPCSARAGIGKIPQNKVNADHGSACGLRRCAFGCVENFMIAFT